MRTFPTLYKKTNTGTIQYWKISVDGPQSCQSVGIIHVEYGHVGTSNPQTTDDIVSQGKNEGKKNETTPLQQAQKQAAANWTKQKKKGYVESLELAQTDKVDSVIEGGINPMLAQKFSEQGSKIAYPCFFQPKLDGIRCIAIITNGKCTLWSRTRKRINSVPHIVEELEEAFAGQTITLDGELYNHALHANFEKIVSIVRKDEADLSNMDTYLVEYHVYDIVDEGVPFFARFAKLNSFFNGILMSAQYVTYVRTGHCQNSTEVPDAFETMHARGYEGIMLRNYHGKYVNKRSSDLQKVKKFDEEEFNIIGIEEGNGRLRGHVGGFICQIEDRQFVVKMKGSMERLKQLFDDHSLWEGKKLTVQFQGLTGTNKVPRFPVGKEIRDYE